MNQVLDLVMFRVMLRRIFAHGTLVLFASCRPQPPAEPVHVAPEYVDSAECDACHAEIAEKYRLTGMGRSFFRPSVSNKVEDYQSKNTYHHTASGRFYTMIERDGRFYQRRHQVGPGGEEVNVVEQRVDYVIGSGNHVRTYLHRTPQQKLVELPVAWYAENGGHWGMNPGYDWQRHSDFRRKITMECLFCHNAYPESKKDSDRADMEAVLPGKIPEGIDCQRCHGPGGEHVRSPGLGNIVNPAKLSSERSLEVCMQCHLETTSAPLPYAIRRFDRGLFSFKPGRPLADYMIHFDHAPGTGHDDKFEIAGSAYRLRKSRCFIESAGEMTCTTCHDPHDIPRGEAADRHYTAVCEKCHATPIANHPSSKDCVGCHMPKRRTDDVVQAVMTDHYIQRKKPSRDLLAPLVEHHGADEKVYRGEVVLYYPPSLPSGAVTELYLAAAQRNSRQRLAAAVEKYRPKSGGFYFELAKVSPDAEAIGLYRKALESMPDYWPALHRLGLAYSRTGQLDRAIDFLRRASERATEGTVLNDLALIYRRLGKTSEALAALRKSVAMDPGLPHVHNNLGGMLLDSGDLKGAEEQFREAIRVQPDLSAAHANLAGLLMKRGDLSAAQFHFETAVQVAAPGETSALEAHMALANMMEMQGNLDRAAAHYMEVLKADSSSAIAHFSLGAVLAMQGKRPEALRHFQNAAEGTDPAIRQSAQEAIRALRRPD